MSEATQGAVDEEVLRREWREGWDAGALYTLAILANRAVEERGKAGEPEQRAAWDRVCELVGRWQSDAPAAPEGGDLAQRALDLARALYADARGGPDGPLDLDEVLADLSRLGREVPSPSPSVAAPPREDEAAPAPDEVDSDGDEIWERGSHTVTRSGRDVHLSWSGKTLVSDPAGLSAALLAAAAPGTAHTPERET